MTEFTYRAETNSILVEVEPFYLDDESSPDESNFVWAYRVCITNAGSRTVQLVGRSWVITDGVGRMIEVEGAGVAGEQPTLEPGDCFEYTSGTPLETATGFMRGSYHMVITATGELFNATIPTFSLDSPHCHQSLH